MATYRVRVPANGVEPGAGTVNLDAWIEREVAPDVWVLIQGGHRTLQLDAEAVIVILNSGATVGQQITLLKALVVEEAKKSKIERGDEAYNGLVGLAAPPYEFEVTVG